MKSSLDRFFEELSSPKRSLVVVNNSKPKPLVRMVENTFEHQSIDVSETNPEGTDDDVVVLLSDEGSERKVIATSPLEALEETVLLVNSDLYRTGTAGFSEGDLPDVLAGLEEVPFRLRGYPHSNKEKLLLIVMSRFVERRAFERGSGRLRTSFQRLSRIHDERGTAEVYRTLGRSDVQTHVYGVPDGLPPEEFSLVSHAGYTEEFRRSWFVVHTPPDHRTENMGGSTVDAMEDGEGDGREHLREGDRGSSHAALLALETAPRRWKGFWTFRPSLVREIDEYVARNL
ncbi:MAG: DICT sensory domain-containing protein [Haloferacaceae archaeon]